MRRRLGAGKIVLIILGSIALLVSLGLVAGGSVLLWADRTQRDSDGYVTSSIQRVDGSGYAVVAPDIDVAVPGWMTGADRLGSVRISVTPAPAGGAVFVGIAPRAGVDAYLAGVDRDVISSWRENANRVSLDHLGGGAPAGPPLAQSMWVASSSGPGTQTVVWQVVGGNWAVVAMNVDASRGLSLDAAVGATAPFLLPLSIGLLCGGVLVAILGLLFVVLGLRPGRPAAAGWAPPAPAGWAPQPPPPMAAPASPAALRFTVYPVALQGHLDEPLNRWLWLVKWVLAIPHYIVLALLSVAALLLSIAAWFAIVATGRYPRSIFDFNLGVMRWWWRVAFYSYSALGTDRYPPFSLGEEPGYPARLDVAYPERLSRGLALVKSWLLAIPHLVIVGLLAGGFGWRAVPFGAGVIAALVLVAGILLLVNRSYNRQLFDLIMALNRWVFRVVAYVALMRDEYPPFRVDLGENEPDVAGTAPAAMTPRPLGT